MGNNRFTWLHGCTRMYDWDNNCELNREDILEYLNYLNNENIELKKEIANEKLQKWRLTNHLKIINSNYTDKYFESIFEGKGVVIDE